MQKVILLSHIINEETPLYSGEKSISIKKVKSIKQGSSCNKTYWSFPAHTGTHLDAPRHFLDKGRAISDFLPGELVFRKVCLLAVRNIKPGCIIGEKDLSSVKDCELLLIKTRFEKHRGRKLYWKNSPCLDDKLAIWLKKACSSIRAVGVDFISISNLKNRVLGRLAHRAFLERGIFLIEDMKLSGLKARPELVIVSPLFVDGAEAAPATVLAVYN